MQSSIARKNQREVPVSSTDTSHSNPDYRIHTNVWRSSLPSTRSRAQ